MADTMDYVDTPHVMETGRWKITLIFPGSNIQHSIDDEDTRLHYAFYGFSNARIILERCSGLESYEHGSSKDLN